MSWSSDQSGSRHLRVSWSVWSWDVIDSCQQVPSVCGVWRPNEHFRFFFVFFERFLKLVSRGCYRSKIFYCRWMCFTNYCVLLEVQTLWSKALKESPCFSHIFTTSLRTFSSTALLHRDLRLYRQWGLHQPSQWRGRVLHLQSQPECL